MRKSQTLAVQRNNLKFKTLARQFPPLVFLNYCCDPYCYKSVFCQILSPGSFCVIYERRKLMFFLPPPSPLSPLTNVPPTSLTVKPLFTFLHTTNCREQIVFLDISCKKDPRKSLPFFHKILIHLECTTSFFYETFLASCVQRTVRDFVCLAYLCTLFWLRSFLLSLPPSSILGDGRGKMGRKCRQKID